MHLLLKKVIYNSSVQPFQGLLGDLAVHHDHLCHTTHNRLSDHPFQGPLGDLGVHHDHLGLVLWARA